MPIRSEIVDPEKRADEILREFQNQRIYKDFVQGGDSGVERLLRGNYIKRSKNPKEYVLTSMGRFAMEGGGLNSSTKPYAEWLKKQRKKRAVLKWVKSNTILFLNNEWVKGILIGVIVGIIMYFILE